MNLGINNGWGIVRTIVDLVRGMSGPSDNRKYVLVKDPNKSLIRLYEVPNNTFEEDDDAGAGLGAAAGAGDAEEAEDDE